MYFSIEDQEYRWQWIGTCPGTLTGEDEVDMECMRDNAVVGLGIPIVLKISEDWYPNEICCLREGLSQTVFPPVGYEKQLVIQTRPKLHKFPEYNTMTKRLETFKDSWPKYMTPSPEQLAQSGFFYTGPSDRVTCYHCGLVLLNWKPTDQPWTEHAQYSPQCVLVKTFMSSL